MNAENRRPPSATISIIRDLFDRIDAKGVPMVALAATAGYDRVAISRMRHGGATPLLSTFADVAQAAGYQLALTPIPEKSQSAEGNQMHFIIDCDDVLLDWRGGFTRWLGENQSIFPCSLGSKYWGMSQWLGVTPERSLELIAEFNASPAFGELVACPGAQNAVDVLRFRDHRLTVVTSCSADPLIVRRRESNLRAAFGDAFNRVICLPLGESKLPWLQILRHGVWVEDNYRNALAGFQAGHKTFMIRQPWNRADEPHTNPHIQWVDNWAPIISLFA